MITIKRRGKGVFKSSCNRIRKRFQMFFSSLCFTFPNNIFISYFAFPSITTLLFTLCKKIRPRGGWLKTGRWLHSRGKTWGHKKEEQMNTKRKSLQCKKTLFLVLTKFMHCSWTKLATKLVSCHIETLKDYLNLAFSSSMPH